MRCVYSGLSDLHAQAILMGENVRGDLSRGDQGQDLTAEGTFRDQAAAGMQLPPPEAGGTGVAKALGLD